MKRELNNIEEILEEIRILDTSIEKLVLSGLQINCEFDLHQLLIEIGYQEDEKNIILLCKTLEFKNVTFANKVTIEKVDLLSLRSIGTTHDKEFNICNCQIGGLFCYHTTYTKGIRIKDSSFDGEITFLFSDFNSTIWISGFGDFNYPVYLSHSNINADVFIQAVYCKSFNASSTDFKGEVKFQGIEFENKVDFDRCIFRKKVWFNKIEFKSNASFKQVEFKDRAYFTGISVSENSELDFSNAEVEKLFAYRVNKDDVSQNSVLGKILFDSFKIMPNAVVSLRNIQTKIGEVNFRDAIIMGVLDIKNVLVSKVDFEGAIFVGNLIEKNFNAKSLNRDTCRLLKNEALKGNDSIKALEYHAKEMKEYQNESSIFKNTCVKYRWLRLLIEYLKKIFIYIPNLKLFRFINVCLNNIPIFFNWISNNHGLSWSRGVVFTFTISILTSLCILGSSESIICDFTMQGFKFAWFLVIKIINITNWKDFPFEMIGWSYVWLFLGRIFIGYGYYQTAQAFRRFGKR